ncbi:ISL3 family transposase [Candidatus Spongiisocius sp.]|uniref:ISL3 family transposase n=1 Tax=Candidatus Spongiisocius sp. TaxID=3101273 RepID=UPI003B5BFF50
MEADPTRMCELLVGLGEVDLVGIGDGGGDEPLEVVIRSRRPRPTCDDCGSRLWSKGYRTVVLVDLPAFGRPVRLRWRKRRWACPNPGCAVGSFVEQDPGIGPERALLTSRAARWVTVQVGKLGRPVDEVATELGCGWHTVNNEVARWGEALLEADTSRVGQVEAVGVDETLFWRQGRWRTKVWCTSVVDVGGRQLIDIVAGRTAESAARWFRSQPVEWRDGIRWAVLDMSGPYRTAYDRVLPNAAQVADPFHVIRLANQRLDEVRRRVQNETLGHRGRKHDPLYRIRRLLTSASERISDRGRIRLRGLLDAGDPHGEVRTAWHAKETVRGIYQIDSIPTALRYTLQLADDLQHESCPPEINKLGRTIARWTPQIANWHISKVTNGPTEALNNLIKRIKRTAFGFRNFANYRIRALLYAGKPNWNLLTTITPH